MRLKELYTDDVESILCKWDRKNRDCVQQENGDWDKKKESARGCLTAAYVRLFSCATLGLVSSIALTIISYTARFMNKSREGFEDWNEAEKKNLQVSYELLGHLAMSLISSTHAIGNLREWHARGQDPSCNGFQ